MTENNNEEKYDLYTEHIVKDPWQTFKRRFKKALILLVIAVLFGAVAGLVMLVIYKTGKNYLDDNKAKIETSTEAATTTVIETESTTEMVTTETVTIPTTEAPTEEVVTTAPLDSQIQDIANYSYALAGIVEDVSKSMVTVTVINENVDWFNSTYQDIASEYGLVVTNGEDGYYILTDYSLVKDKKNISVTYNDNETENAVFIAGDRTTNLAVIKTESNTNASVKVAKIGNASALSKGNVVIGVGRLYGFSGAMGYGMVTGKNNSVCDTDAIFSLITTDIVGSGSPEGVLTNLSGEVIGIITTAYNSDNSNLITAYAFDGISAIIERLSNGKATVYLGVKAQEVTTEIMNTYRVPAGVYVSAVEANSPAYTAGIQTGDIISEINGKKVTTMEGFMVELSRCNVGDSISIMVSRKGRDSYKSIEINLMLGVE